MSQLGNIEALRSLLLIIDIQTKLAPAISHFTAILKRSLQLAQASEVLTIPTLITEQYSKGLGNTHKQLQHVLPNADYFHKTYFSAVAEPDFLTQLTAYNRPQIVVIGTEAHVCVLQTCLDLLQHGFSVIVAADAVGSRDDSHKALALAQLRQAGAVISCTETIIFQWTKQAATATFKQILPIIK
jgi:nicotinamidase-related amidase